ncbi:TRAP transporter substrate-binding protein [Rubrimonas sp.]|uniref:TRAP transporter substrate-binding protein n=1 Tax=Rubrimonas sp. TaxID=2036015 RepID=UPI002FDCF979
MRLTAASLGLAALGFAAPAALAETWDMPLAYPATNFHSETAAAFAACVGEATGGALQIVTHPGGALYGGAEIKRAVQTGQTPIGERLLSAHQNEKPIYGVDSIPFLVSSFDEHEKLWEIAAPHVAEALAEDGLVYLYSVPWPPQGLYMNRAVAAADDLKGVKFRSYSAATARLAELTGMTPVQVEAAELSQALATGVAESFVSSAATGYDTKVWEHLSHFYEVDAWLPRNAIFANKAAFDALDAAAQSALTDCAAKAKAEGLARSKAYTTRTLDGLKAGGMEVGRAEPALVEALKAIGATMTEEWLASAGETGRAVVDAYRAGN